MSEPTSVVQLKVAAIRNTLRKEYLNQYFQAERNRVVQRRNQGQSNEGPYWQLTQVYQSFMEIIKSPQQIKEYSIEWLYPFLGRDASYQAKMMASEMLGEYLYHSQQVPALETLQVVMGLLRESSNQILANCLRILFILTSYFQHLKMFLIEQTDLISLIVDKIYRERESERIVILLMKLVNSMLNLPEGSSPIEIAALVKPISFLLENQEVDSEVVLLAVLNLRFLIKAPVRCGSVVGLLTDYLLPRLVLWFGRPRYETRRLAYSIIDIIEVQREFLGEGQMQRISNIFLQGLAALKGCSDSNLSAINVRIIKEKIFAILLLFTQEKTQNMLELFCFNNCHFARELWAELLGEEEKKIVFLISKMLYIASYHLSNYDPFFRALKAELPAVVPEDHSFNFQFWRNQTFMEEEF